MSYLDKAKGVLSQKSDKSREMQGTKETNDTNEPSQTAQTVLHPVRNNSPDIVPRLPWQLERLIRAACSDQLPKGTMTLESGLVTDSNRYTLAWAASYLTGDRNEAVSKLWQMHRVWQADLLS